MRNVVTESVKQIAENDSVSLAVRRAIQRGIALKKIKIDSNHNASMTVKSQLLKK